MQDSQAFILAVKNLSGEQNPEEQGAFLKWRKESESNDELYFKVKVLWDQRNNKATSFLGKFTPKKIKGFIVNQAIGNFIGFAIGLSVTNHFSHYVVERKRLSNLFGLAGRKQVEVNDVPEWLQWALPVVIGFIALEFVNYFFETKKHQKIGRYFKGLVKRS